MPDDRLRFQVAYEKRCAWSTETLFFFLKSSNKGQGHPTTVCSYIYLKHFFHYHCHDHYHYSEKSYCAPLPPHDAKQFSRQPPSHAKGTICNVDFQRNKALQYCCDLILNSSNIVPTLQRSFALLTIAQCESSRATAPYLDYFTREL